MTPRSRRRRNERKPAIMCETCGRINLDETEPPRRNYVPLSKQNYSERQSELRERYDRGEDSILLESERPSPRDLDQGAMEVPRVNEEEKLIAEIVEAWNNPGPYPRFHEEVQRTLRDMWPMLYRPVKKLAKIRKKERQ